MSKQSNSGKYPECDNCLNREYDPFQCDTCEDGCNYEPPEDDLNEEFDDAAAYSSFITWIKEIA